MCGFIRRDQLPDYVDIDLIHVNLNGKREQMIFPEGLLPMKELPHLALTDQQIETFYKIHEII
jgi:hypothetical protein